MGSERFRGLQLELQQVRRFIGILFAALIASDLEDAIDNRTRGDGIRFAQRDSLPEIYAQTFANVKPTVLAENDPEIAVIFPHTTSPQAVTKWEVNPWNALKRSKTDSNMSRKLFRLGDCSGRLRSLLDRMKPGSMLFFPLFDRKNSSSKAS